MPETETTGPFGAVLFDLLTGLLDSWTLWNDVAGDATTGRRWREAYLRRTYAAGAYRPYQSLVAEAARDVELGGDLAAALLSRWDELTPWAEAPAVVGQLAHCVPVGVITNCSDDLGQRAADRVGVPFDVVITAETAGFYKPRPEPYRRAIEAVGLPPNQILFVAGSRYDIAGASAVGMAVWWHNRIGLQVEGGPSPLVEERTLHALPNVLAAHDQE